MFEPMKSTDDPTNFYRPLIFRGSPFFEFDGIYRINVKSNFRLEYLLKDIFHMYQCIFNIHGN